MIIRRTQDVEFKQIKGMPKSYLKTVWYFLGFIPVYTNYQRVQ